MPESLAIRADADVGPLRLQINEDFNAPWTVIFGASGSGKSSLLRLICGLWRPHGTRLMLRGDDVTHLPPERRAIVLVPQRTSLFPHRSVMGNLRFGAKRGAESAAWLLRLIEELELGGLLTADVRTLSGGERQRVELARALAARPRVLLLDEAFAGLHAPLRARLVDQLRCFSEELPCQIISVTHDVAEAWNSADDLLRLEEGRVTGRGAPPEMLREERALLLQQVREPGLGTGPPERL